VFASDHHPRRILCRGTFWTGVAAILSWTVSGAQVPSTKECEVKAAFVYNFTKFVEWPAGAFSQPQSPIVIGVLGESSCTEALRAIVRDHQVNGRTLEVKVVVSASQIKPIHVLFVSAEHEAMFESLATQIRTTPVLTVGESVSFGPSGGAITFVPVSDKLRFAINTTAADLAGLKLSSQLQKLAITVRKEQ
jgi:hypothetical protein